MRVWDVPTRLFHWAIVLLLGASWITQRLDWMELHFLSGYSMLAMLLFRLGWGFFGSETARFGRFLKGPLEALRHLARLHRPEQDTEIGHNAAGGWMVLVMLVLLAVQVATGLCANDDISVQGPLADYVGKAWSDWLTHIHAVNFEFIELAIGLHIIAIAAYAVLKRQNLVGPMITGRKRLPATVTPPKLASPLLAIALLGMAVAAVAVLVNAL
jgi:cytochrome b